MASTLKVGDFVRLTDDALGHYPPMPHRMVILDIDASSQIARRMGVQPDYAFGAEYVGGIELRHLKKVGRG